MECNDGKKSNHTQIMRLIASETAIWSLSHGCVVAEGGVVVAIGVVVVAIGVVVVAIGVVVVSK